ncbi:hypothetical protein PoB_007193200 [Plakobranchus ocellatus]|uniref:Uncharacterized protein n=1 Tax=Plakobranchus ocellatus TaxID=259542 RepID=A0AAV4DMU4_9GAST|nr:hypothetical protein PoB_007193200 [Plakobranchus ocellatus]
MFTGGTVAHLVGRLATRKEVRGSNRSPNQVNFPFAPLCPSSTKWVARSGESKGGEESNGKLPHNAVCQEQSGPYSWFPDAWIKHGTHFFFHRAKVCVFVRSNLTVKIFHIITSLNYATEQRK